MAETKTDLSSIKSNRFETVVAVAIASTSILVALFAGAAARQYSFAADSDRSSVVAVVNKESVNLTAHARQFENKRRHAEHMMYGRLAGESSRTAAAAESPLKDTMDTRAQEFRAVANTAALYYSPNHIQQDGSFNDFLFLEDELQVQFLRRDVDPVDDLDQAGIHYNMTSNLMISVVSFSFAIVLLTLAQSTSSRLRYVLLAGGIMVAFSGVCFFVMLNLLLDL